MPQSSPTRPDRLHPRERGRTPAFTLIELLVVIGILILVAGILLPIVGRANKSAGKTKTTADLAVIGVALEAYKADFGSYPYIDTVSNDPTVRANLGMTVLCKALVAPGNATAGWTSPTYTAPYQPGAVVRSGGNDYVALVETRTLPTGTDWVLFNTIDGYDSPGFKTRTSGAPVRGPYVQVDRLKTNGMAIITSTGPVLYFPASPLKPSITSANGFVTSTGTGKRTSYYNADDNYRAFQRTTDVVTLPPLPLSRIRAMLGDVGDGTGGPPDGQIDAGETAFVTGPYILWAPGDDGKFGPDEPTVLSQVKACDDIISPQP